MTGGISCCCLPLTTAPQPSYHPATQEVPTHISHITCFLLGMSAGASRIKAAYVRHCSLYCYLIAQSSVAVHACRILMDTVSGISGPLGAVAVRQVNWGLVNCAPTGCRVPPNPTSSASAARHVSSHSLPQKTRRCDGVSAGVMAQAKRDAQGMVKKVRRRLARFAKSCCRL